MCYIWNFEGDMGIVNMPLLHFVFNEQSLTHYNNLDIQKPLYDALPFIYCVIACKTEDQNRQVLGGYITKISTDNTDDDFLESISGYFFQEPELRKMLEFEPKFYATKINTEKSDVLSEIELLKIVMTEYLKLHSQGNA